jgi:hypothetical protein
VYFNLHGEFDFSDERMVDSMNLNPQKIPVWSQAKFGMSKTG